MNDQDDASRPTRITLESILEKFSQAKSHRPDTVDHYRKLVKRLEKDTGIRYLDDISDDRFLDWRKQIIDRSSPTNWNNHHRHIRALLNFCVELDLIRENPLNRIKQSNRANSRRERCTIEDIHKCIHFLENDTRDPIMARFVLNMLLVLCFTAMRRSQLCGLVWSDINFRTETILLRKEHSKTAHQWTIPLHENLLAPLIEMKREVRNRMGSMYSKHDQVFFIQRYNPRFAGNRMKPEQITGIFKRLARNTGTRIGAHNIRHLVATLLANQFVTNQNTAHSSLVAIKELLGHEDIKTTVGYIETDLSTQRELIKGLDRITFKGKPPKSKS